DPEVKAAIRALNRERKPKLVLGPFFSPQEYQAKVVNDDLALLEEKGVVPRKDRKQFVLAAEEQVVTLAFQVQKLYDGLKAAEVRSGQKQSSHYDDLVARRAKVAAALAAAPAYQQQRFKAELAELDRQLAQAAPKGGVLDFAAAERARKEALDRKELLI